MSIRNNVRAIRGQNCTRNMNIQKLRDSKNGKTGKRESVELGKWLKGRESDKGRETGDAGTAEEALGANEAVYVKTIEGRGLRVERTYHCVAASNMLNAVEGLGIFPTTHDFLLPTHCI